MYTREKLPYKADCVNKQFDMVNTSFKNRNRFDLKRNANAPPDQTSASIIAFIGVFKLNLDSCLTRGSLKRGICTPT